MNHVMNPTRLHKIAAVVRLCFVIGFACSFAGCGATATSTTAAGKVSEEHAPETFAEALKQLDTQKSNIQAAFEKSDPESAHHDLHTIGRLFESLPDLAKKAGIADADLPAVKVAVDSLFDAFGKLDETLHGGDETPYKEVAEQIETAIVSLKKMAPK